MLTSVASSVHSPGVVDELPLLNLDDDELCERMDPWVQTAATNGTPGEGSMEWKQHIREMAQLFPGSVVHEEVELSNKFAPLHEEEEHLGQCGCPGHVGTSVASGSEYVAGRSLEQEWKVLADQACRGSGNLCDSVLPDTPLMSSRSAPEGFASSDSCSAGQCADCAESKIEE